MKKIILTLIAVVSIVVSCSKGYDDTEVNNRIDDLIDRVDKLEDMCRQFNSDISALQAIVDAMQGGDFITGVKAVVKDGMELGYTITFNSGKVITIYHGQNGQDGEDGHNPVVGIKRDSDGVYYWTLDGEWLLDDSGKKVKAMGQDGEEGITPQLKIEDGYWYVSYDNGATWTKLDKATGKDGESMFREIRYDDDNVCFVLMDGTELLVPRSLPLSITFDTAEPVSLSPNSSLDIPYTISSAAEDVTIDVSSSIDLKAKVVATDMLHGKIHIESGAIIDEYSKVVVVVSDGNKTILRSLTFAAAQGNVFELSTNKVNLSAMGGEFVVKVVANIGYYISSKSEWIEEVSKVNDPAAHTTTHTFKVGANPANEVRNGVIVFCNDNQVCIPVTVIQSATADIENSSFYHRSVAMRFTADWCGFCPIMAKAFDKAKEETDDKLEVISVHCDGGLVFTSAAPLANQFSATAFPTGIVDGRIFIGNDANDNGVANMAELTKQVIRQTEEKYSTSSGISFKSSVDGRSLSVDLSMYFKEAETYKYTVLLVEDNIVAYQADYVNGESDDYVHNGVARMALTSVTGDQITAETANAVKTVNLTCSVPSAFNFENMRVVVYVQRQFGSRPVIQSGSYGDWYIDNSASAKDGETLELRLAE